MDLKIVQTEGTNHLPSVYLLHSHGKWPIEIDGLPIKNVDFPWLCNK